jgi:outer membrane protein TolC
VTAGRFTAAALVLLVVSASAAAGQEVQVPASELLTTRSPEPPKLTNPTLTLAQAVQFSIRNTPQVRQSSQAVLSATGRLQQTNGLFDFTFLARPVLTVQRQQLTPFLADREVAKRNLIKGVVESFTGLTNDLRAEIASGVSTVPECPFALTFGGDPLLTDQIDPKELALRGVKKDIRSIVIVDFQQEFVGVNLSAICDVPINALTGEQFVTFWRLIDQQFRIAGQASGLGISDLLANIAQISNEVRRGQAQITQAVAARGKLALDQIGPVPEDDLLRHFTVDFNLSKQLRQGLFVSLNFQLQSQEHNFVDKPLDPQYGAFDEPTEMFTETSGTVTIPFQRGLGATSTEAQERIARHLLASQRQQLRHDISTQVFQTVLAYLNAIAAQDNVTLLEESATRQQRILDLAQGQVTAGDLPQVDLNRARASAASVAGALNAARASLLEARVSLARTIGVDLDTLDAAPQPSETFANAQAGEPNVAALLPHALMTRSDIKAAEERRLAAEAAVAGARVDTRPLINLSLTGGYANLYSSPFFKYLPDGVGKIVDMTSPQPLPITVTGSPRPVQSPVRYWEPRGFYRALTGRYEPFFIANFDFRLPIGNNAAKGRLAQTQAMLQTSTTDAIDLQRIIGENVIGTSEGLRRSAAEVARRQTAVTADEQTLNAAIQRFQIREVTLIDTLLTEDDLTIEKLRLMRARQVYYSLLARLKFETGDLVAFDQPGTSGEVIRFLPTGFVGR